MTSPSESTSLSEPSQLPLEIWSRILSFALAGPPLEPEDRFETLAWPTTVGCDKVNSTKLSAMRVCRLWKDLSLPFVYGELHITHTRALESIYSLLTRDHPLDLTDVEASGRKAGAVDLLRPRVLVLTFDSTLPFPHFCDLLKRLTNLDSMLLPSALNGEHLRALRSPLRIAQARGHMQDLSAIHALSHLERLVLEFQKDTWRDDSNDRDVVLERLHSVDLTWGSGRRCSRFDVPPTLSFPVLRTLTLRVIQNTFASEGARFFQRVQDTVQTLYIGPPASTYDDGLARAAQQVILNEALIQLPKLESLRLDVFFPPIEHDNLRLLRVPYQDAVCKPEYSAAVIRTLDALPKLRILEMDYWLTINGKEGDGVVEAHEALQAACDERGVQMVQVARRWGC